MHASPLPLLLAALLLATGCRSSAPAARGPQPAAPSVSVPVAAPAPRWPEGVAYEVFVRAFADTNGDGIGDLNGVTARLDYLQRLGVNAIWLMPISPSPSYHQYDVTDYEGVDTDYGTLDDARTLVREAHRRGIAVILDLVVNHTSRQHPWFVRAASDPSSPERGFYVWEDSAAVRTRYRAATADTGTRMPWHRDPRQAPGDGERYYGVFGGNMPDLNFDSPEVRRRIVRAARFWLTEVGVDGFRLDAAKHIFPDARAADSHAFWQDFRDSLRVVKPEVYLVGEVWDRPEVVAPYLRGLPSLFNFSLAGAAMNAARTGRADSLAHRLAATRDAYARANPAFVDATFLTNHDQTRVASALGGERARARVAASLLLTLPGAPFLYYGEEIGMPGRKPDEHIREPMPWGEPSTDAARTTRWIAPRDATPEAVPTVAAEEADPASLWHHYRRLIALRRAHPALLRGEIAPLDVRVASGDASAALSFLRVDRAGERLWVVHNLSARPLAVDVPAPVRAFTRVVFVSADGAEVRGGTVALPPMSVAVLAERP